MVNFSGFIVNDLVAMVAGTSWGGRWWCWSEGCCLMSGYTGGAADYHGAGLLGSYRYGCGI